MNFFSQLLLYAVLALTAENLLFAGGIGLSRALRAARKPHSLPAYAAAVTFFSLLLSLCGSSLINSRYYMDKTSYNLSYGVAWDNTEYVIVSIAVDAEGNRGELQKVPFRVDKSLAEELTELP